VARQRKLPEPVRNMVEESQAARPASRGP